MNDKLNYIKEIRAQQNLTLRILSLKSDMSISSINMIENGKRIPSQLAMLRISKGLNRPTHEVFKLNWEELNL